MAKHMQNKQGYILLEMIVCLSITCILMLLTLNYYNINFNHTIFSSEYMNAKANSILNKEKTNINTELFNNEQVYFNNKGHINKANTIYYNNHSYVIRLGFGNIRYE